MYTKFSDRTNGTVVYNYSYGKRRTHINKEDFNIYQYIVHCNKRYHIKMTATSKIRLVVVMKLHTKPELCDFYGGERLSNTATLLIVDFAKARLLRMEQNSTASGLEYVVEDANSSSVSLFGMVHCSGDTTTAYVGIMPTVYDTTLCKLCIDSSKGPCGFCSGEDEDGDGIEFNVRLTVVRYVTDCVFWNPARNEWDNDGCQVSVLCGLIALLQVN